MAVLMVQKNIIKRLIKEIQNAKRRGNMSKIPEQTSKYNSRWYKDEKVGTRACPNGKIKKNLILTSVKNNSYGQDFEQERGFVLVLVPAP